MWLPSSSSSSSSPRSPPSSSPRSPPSSASFFLSTILSILLQLSSGGDIEGRRFQDMHTKAPTAKERILARGTDA
ncbi:unnamed protein product [Victoria cruziana]